MDANAGIHRAIQNVGFRGCDCCDRCDTQHATVRLHTLPYDLHFYLFLVFLPILSMFTYSLYFTYSWYFGPSPSLSVAPLSLRGHGRTVVFSFSFNYIAQCIC